MTAPTRRRGEHAQLTRQAVTDRALRLADAARVGALTIRGLATELGVTPTALYWHFRSEDGLPRGGGESCLPAAEATLGILRRIAGVEALNSSLVEPSCPSSR